MISHTGKVFPVFVGALLLSIHSLPAAQNAESDGVETGFEIKSVVVAGKEMPAPQNREIKLGAFPKQIEIHFSPATNLGRLPVRLRFKLEGYDREWQSGGGAMNMNARFYNESGDQISHEK